MGKELSHTPGPWSVRICQDQRCGWPQIDGSNDEEVVVSHTAMSRRISDADAKLIAAAPQLLDELIQCLRFISAETGLWREAGALKLIEEITGDKALTEEIWAIGPGYK